MTNVRLYKTGGAVRDELLGRRSKDLDFSVEAPSYAAMLEHLKGMGLVVWQERPEFLTVRGKLPGVGDADFVLCRADGHYSDGRRPDSVRPGTLMDDLKRRDFTVNAMARALDADGGTLVDPFGGRADLDAKLLRCVGDSRARFTEDSLRLVRAVRFAVTLGFELHPHVAASLRDPQLLALLDNVAVERTREELHKAFKCDTGATLELLGAFPGFRRAVMRRGLWLKPTLEDN